jgi:metal-responsive CopG/Arc/MetJ family transcriptional regulator
LVTALDAYAEKEGISRSEAVRQLIERGLGKPRRKASR